MREQRATSTLEISPGATYVAERWSQKLGEGSDFSPDFYWLGLPEVRRQQTLRGTGGRRDDSWVNYCVFELLAGRTPVERMLSIGCGTGELERHLSLFPAFEECDAWDISPGAIETARRHAREEGVRGIHYEVRDANTAEIPESCYDAVWFHSSLHHVEALERVCERVARGLKPGGWLFLNEYVGPSVFALPERQKQVIRAAFDLIPPRLRRPLTAPAIPSPAAVVADDPSEAVRSADILAVVGHYFDVVEHHRSGGTVLQFLLQGIAGNFRSEDPEATAILDLLLRIESTLIDVGDLESDFAVVAARRRDPPAPPRPAPAAPAAPPPASEEPPVSAAEARSKAEVERLRATIRQIESTRVWRAAHLYWGALRRLRSWLGRRPA